MGKHIGLSLAIIFLLFFLPWLWGEPSQATDPEPADPPPPAEDIPADSTALPVLGTLEVTELEEA